MTQNNLPKEEQNVLNMLIEAKGHPLRVKVIADQLGIQDNHCSKLIKFLTDKGFPIERDYVVVDGKKKSYKEYWLSEPQKGPLKPENDLGDQEVNWKQDDKNPCPICGSCYKIDGVCNMCVKSVNQKGR